MTPPRTLVNSAAWDQYWRDQFTHEVADWVHVFCDDGALVDLMRANGLRTVLCVGSGISHEPRALARAGFAVTALDLSPFALEVAKRATPSDEILAGLIGGRSPAPNGQVEFVVGDLCNAALCPGPYDVVIERKTLQLYPDEQLPAAAKAVADRLASRGVFFSHCHDGGGRKGEGRHRVKPWFVAEGWKFRSGETPLQGQVAWVFTTTG
jgi:SAM-dependent methyltransferase